MTATLGVAGKAGRYLLTGGLAAIVDLSTFAAMLGMGVVVPVAAGLSFVTATGCNYWLAAGFVFGATRSLAGYFRFLTAAALGFLVNVGLTTWLPGPLVTMLPATMTALLPPLPVVAKVIAIGVMFVFSFAINLRLVFRPRG